MKPDIKTFHTDIEREQLEQLAQEYQTRGYEVILWPTEDNRPQALKGLTIGLIAFKSEDPTIVADVRSYQHFTLGGNADLKRITAQVALIEAAYELIILNPHHKTIMTRHANSTVTVPLVEASDGRGSGRLSAAEQALAHCQSLWPQGEWQTVAYGDCFDVIGALACNIEVELEVMPDGAIAEIRLNHFQLARSSRKQLWQDAFTEIAAQCYKLTQTLMLHSGTTPQNASKPLSKGYPHPTEGWQSSRWPE